MASRRDRARAVAEAMFADEHGPPPPARIAWLCDDLEDFIERAGPRSEFILGGALALATWVAPLAIARRPPLGRLPVADRSRALEAIERTPAGLPLLALKAMLCTMYFEHEDTRREIGIDPDGARR